jgi:hypothetical protein
MRRLAKILISVLGNHLKSMDEDAVNRPSLTILALSSPFFFLCTAFFFFFAHFSIHS